MTGCFVGHLSRARWARYNKETGNQNHFWWTQPLIPFRYNYSSTAARLQCCSTLADRIAWLLELDCEDVAVLLEWTRSEVQSSVYCQIKKRRKVRKPQCCFPDMYQYIMLRRWSPFKVKHLQNSFWGRHLGCGQTCLVWCLKVSSAKGRCQELGWGRWWGWWGSMLKIMQLGRGTKWGGRWTGRSENHVGLVVRCDFRWDRGLDKTDRGDTDKLTRSKPFLCC